MRTLLVVALMLLACGAAQAAATALPAGLTPLESAPLTLPPLGLPDPQGGDLLRGIALPPDLDNVAPQLPAAPPGDDAPAPVLDAPVLAAASAAGGAVLIVAGFALYSRLARSQLLDHERRESILKLIQTSPGIPLSEVGHKTGLAWGTTVYHLERLERAGFILSEKANGRRCFFPVGTVRKEARAGLGALQQETSRDIAQFVATRPGATQTELCEGLGLSASAASKQITKLENAGLVRRERAWKSVTLHPGDRLSELLAA